MTARLAEATILGEAATTELLSPILLQPTIRGAWLLTPAGSSECSAAVAAEMCPIARWLSRGHRW